MNTPTPEELILMRALHEEIDAFEGHPATALDVHRRAREVRRRRLLGGAVAVAAAAALAVVVAQTFHSAPQSAPPVTPGPGPTLKDLTSLTRGKAAGATYLVGRTAYRAGGLTVKVGPGVTALAPYTGGVVAVGQKTRVYDAGGRPGVAGFGAERVGVSADHSAIAFWTTSAPGAPGSLVVGPADAGPASYEVPTPDGAAVEPVAVVGNLVYAEVNPSVGGAQVWVFDRAGAHHRVGGLALLGGVDARGTRLAGQTIGDAGTGAMVDTNGKVLWTRSGWELGGISPNGTRVLGLYQGRAFVLDAETGHDVAALGDLGADAFRTGLIWENDDAVLAVAHDAAHAAVVRFTLTTSPLPSLSLASDVVPRSTHLILGGG